MQPPRKPVIPSIHGIHGLLLDLRGCEYMRGSSLTWHNLARRGQDLDAEVPSGVEFVDTEKAFKFSVGGDVIRAPIATNPHVLREVTYTVWVKVRKLANLAWIICQYPDHGWSRALTLNDYRLGHVSVTTSRYWDSQLGQPPLNQWIHVAGVWHSDGTATVYMNGVRGETAVTNNGKSADCSDEQLIIGGRSSRDPAHNSAVLVSDVCIFNRALSDGEVQLLHSRGRATNDSVDYEQVLTLTEAERLDQNSQLHPTAEALTRTALNEEPTWDDASGLFWCNTGVDPHDLPEGSKWQDDFRKIVQEAKTTVKSRVLVRHGSDVPPPTAGRRLARNPSDPDKRAVRAAHTDALRKVVCPAGVEVGVLGRAVALFRFEGRVFAVDAHCPHQGARLCEGEIGDIEDLVDGHRFYVTCKVHKFQFDLTTGTVIDGHCPPLRIYSARVQQRPSSGVQRATVEVGFEALPLDYFARNEDDF